MNSVSESLKGRIIDLLSKIDKDFVEDSEFPDIFSEDPEKIKIYYVLKILDVIAEKIANLRNQYGVYSLYRLITETVLGNFREDTYTILKEHFEELLPGNEDEFRTVHFEEFINDPDTDFWKRFLLLINMSPKYSRILKDVFGDYGLISVIFLLQSLGEGKINAIVFKEIFSQIQSLGQQ